MIAIALFLIALGAILWLAYELITAPKVDLYGNLRPSDGLTPAKFPEANVEFAKDQPEYKSLPAFRSHSVYGEVITCWKLSFAQRLKLLVAGRLWVSVWTFNEKLQPMYLTSDKHDVLIVKKSWQLRVVQKYDQWRNRLRFKYSLAKAILTEHIGNIVRGGVR